MDNIKPDEKERPISVAAWVGTIIVSLVPLLNVVVFFYWSFRRGVDPNRRNFSRAGLIVICLFLLLTLWVFIYMVISFDPADRIKAFMMLE